MPERDKEGRWPREGVSPGDKSVCFSEGRDRIVVAAR